MRLCTSPLFGSGTKCSDFLGILGFFSAMIGTTSHNCGIFFSPLTSTPSCGEVWLCSCSDEGRYEVVKGSMAERIYMCGWCMELSTVLERALRCHVSLSCVGMV